MFNRETHGHCFHRFCVVDRVCVIEMCGTGTEEDEEEEVKVGKEGEMLREILTENARIKVLLTLTHLRRDFL